MIRVSAGLIAWGFLSLGGTLQDEKKACDMANVKEGLYCETCKAILDDTTTLDKEYCKKCNEGKEAGDRTKARAVRVCVKEYYESTCHPGQRSLTAGTCSTCGGSLEQKVSRALVIYRCEGCGKKSDKEGDCDEEGCKREGKRIKAACSGSEFPHQGEK